MARKPAPLELTHGKGLRQRLWERIRARAAVGADFSLKELVLGGEATATARDYLIGLEKAGYIAVTQTHHCGGRNVEKRWRLARDVGIEAPRVRRDGSAVTQGLAQEQMWRTLVMLGGAVTARELAAHASTDEIPVRETAAADYLGNLLKAGYLALVLPGKGVGRGGIPARYRLTRNTGPRPPMICRTRAIFDPNLGRVVWHDKSVTEEEAIYGR